MATAIAIIFLVLGLFFLFVAAIGMVRLPDVFTRAHAVGVTDTMGAFFMLSGLAIYEGLSLNTLKILVVLSLLYLLNPVVTHATIRAALRAGTKPWVKDPS